MSYNSICSSCKHKANCIYIEHSKDAIIFCEEFELEPVTEDKVIEVVEPNVAEVVKEINIHEYTGLCINCMNNKTCSLHSDSCVIWHCETYKVA